MRDVAGVDHEGWLHRQRPCSRDTFLKRAFNVRIGPLVEANMTVADLQKGKPPCRRRHCFVDDAERGRYTTGNTPKHASAGPCHAFENLAPVDAVIVLSHLASP